jgi:hypothetical protein
MIQVVSRRPLIAKARVRVRVNPCRICGGQSGTGTGFSPSSSVFPCQYHSTVTLQTHIIWGMRNIANVTRHPRLGTRPTPLSGKNKIFGGTPSDELPARRKGLYLHRVTQHTNTKTNIRAWSGIRTHDPSNQASKTYASDRVVTGTGQVEEQWVLYSVRQSLKVAGPVVLTRTNRTAEHCWDSSAVSRLIKCWHV